MQQKRTRLFQSILCIIVLSFITIQLNACKKADNTPSAGTEVLPSLTLSGDNTADNTSAPSDNKQPLESTPVPNDPLAPPRFSAEGGFYDDLFSLTLSSVPGNTIYYTTDGSDPRTSDTAKEYTNGILIYDNTDEPNIYSALTDITLHDYNPPKFSVDKGIVIRAVAKTPEGEFGEPAMNSYFVGKTDDYYSDLRVISLVTDSDYLFDHDTGAYMVGSDYYEWVNSDDYEPKDNGDTGNPTNYNKDGRESEFPVTIQVFEDGKSVYTANIGARISGNWSRAFVQKSIRLYAREEYGTKKMKYAFFEGLTDLDGNPIEKFDKITLWNGGNDAETLHFRDAFIQDLADGLAVDTIASEPYLLFINGEFWGFYLLREKVEDYYIQSHYGIDKDDVAVIKNGSLDSGTEDDSGDYWNFCKWVSEADMAQDRNYMEFCAKMDLQSFMDYMAVETYVNNSDWANGYMNNWIVWRSKTINPDIPEADGKWHFVFYDMDISSGLYGSTETSFRYDSLNTNYVDGSGFNLPAMLQSLKKNPDFRQSFYDNYNRIIDTVFAPDTVNAKLNQYAASYKEATQAGYLRFGLDWAANNYDSQINDLRTFFEHRPKYAKRYLDAFCGIESDFAETYSENLLSDTDTWSYYGDATFRTDASDNSFLVSVPQVTVNSWDIQSQTRELTLETGCEYKLTFDASGPEGANLDLGGNRRDGDDWPNCFWDSKELTTDLTHYETYFIMNHDTNTDWKIYFNFGSATGNYVIKNATLVKVE
ncbi:MAG: CotH kinase family protein [Lachnospiraceae bacterium]|nr:CotH kinase family protein [Lachnospiraceae bacterium]